MPVSEFVGEDRHHPNPSSEEEGLIAHVTFTAKRRRHSLQTLHCYESEYLQPSIWEKSATWWTALRKRASNASRASRLLSSSSFTVTSSKNRSIGARSAASAVIAASNFSAAIEAEQFETAMTALAELRGPIDQFFEEVTVNDEDDSKREARLALLARFRKAVHQVADFSQIEG